jgi:hypothetical protein
MSNPTVCAICITADRLEMTKRAIACFRAQTYEPKRLLTYDTGTVGMLWDYDSLIDHHRYDLQGFAATIGELRNLANEEARADILIHWDSDDWSHTNRITEQVEQLQSSDAEAVGYNRVLFWREPPLNRHVRGRWSTPEPYAEDPLGAAYLYTNHNPSYAIGASLCYWRSTWQKHPFEPLPKRKGGTGEDSEFVKAVKCVGYGALCSEPRLICRIHSNNTQDYSVITANSPNWKRTPQYDSYCRQIMEIECSSASPR